MLSHIKNIVGDRLQMRAIRRHGSRVGWKIAGKYTKYWGKARDACPRPMPSEPPIASAIEDYRRDRIASFHTRQTQDLARSIGTRIDRREAAGEAVWDQPTGTNSNVNYAGNLWRDFPEIKEFIVGPLGAFLEGYFGCPYKIFYATMYKSFHVPEGPKNSSLWHSDSGPGTCINVMLYIDDTVREDGAIEVMKWGDALKIFDVERAEIRRRRSLLAPEQLAGVNRRDMLCAWYDEIIKREFADRTLHMVGPAGTVAAFANNTIHRGGFPQPGRRRRVVIFHCYPSHLPTNIALYDERGVKKVESYPKDPAAEF